MIGQYQDVYQLSIFVKYEKNMIGQYRAISIFVKIRKKYDWP
ncbi:953_t:CDS:1, partial [Racocetra fulgida]